MWYTLACAMTQPGHQTVSAPRQPRGLPPKNRRRFTRVRPTQLRGHVVARNAFEAGAWVVDLSLGGAFLRTPKALPVGETVHVELVPPSHREPLRMHAKVVSARGAGAPARSPGMGVRFEAVDPMTMTVLRDLVRSLAPAGAPLEVSTGAASEQTAVAPPPPPAAAMPLVTAAPAQPVEPIPEPKPSVPRPFLGDENEPADTRRLRIQLKGLIMQSGELQTLLQARDREIEVLREAVERLQKEVTVLRAHRCPS